MAAAPRIATITLFETHCYSFDGKTFIQDDGGPIGLRFTACIAKIRMNHWARMLLKILNDSKVKVRLANLYVDDVRLVLMSIMRGLRYVPEEKILIYDPAYEEGKYELMSDYKYICMIVREIMNDICMDMEFTTETHLDFANIFLPTMDCEFQLKRFLK